MTQDEFSRGTFYYDSFGARRVLGWLVTGRIFDNGRIPVVSVLALIGLGGRACGGSGASESARAVPAVGLLSLLLFFGRPTLGAVIDLLPGATDLFLRRYVTGVHLAGIYLAGIGGAWIGTKVMHLVRSRATLAPPRPSPPRLGDPADRRWSRRRRPSATRTSGQGASLDRGATRRRSRPTAPTSPRSSATAKATAPGRIFSGMRANRSAPKIGFVPAFSALLNLDADAVGFTRPTWSIMSNVENRFAAHVAAAGGHVRRALGGPAGRRHAAGRLRASEDRRPVGAVVDGRHRLSLRGRHGGAGRGRSDEPGAAYGGVPQLGPAAAGTVPDARVGGRPGRRADARPGGRPDDPGRDRRDVVRAAGRRTVRRRGPRRIARPSSS